MKLSDRVEMLAGFSNEIDVLIECALEGCRPNSAGTKVIYSEGGKERTYWARDWTISKTTRTQSAAALRERGL